MGSPEADPGLIRVGRVEDFPEGKGMPVIAGGRRIVIYRQDGALHALKDICPHMGEYLHHLPPINGMAACSGHGWLFDLRTGECRYGDLRARVAVYPVVVRGDEVLVRVS